MPGALGLTVTKAAQVLGVSRKALDNLVYRRAAISPEMAVRLATAFGGSAQAWINMQAQHDYAQVAARGRDQGDGAAGEAGRKHGARADKRPAMDDKAPDPREGELGQQAAA